MALTKCPTCNDTVSEKMLEGHMARHQPCPKCGREMVMSYDTFPLCLVCDNDDIPF